MDFFTLILVIVAVILLVGHLLRRQLNYFEELGIAYVPPLPIIGNMASVLFRRICMGEHLQRMYNRFSETKYFGFYNFVTPVIVIRDPELITTIAIKHFDNFTDHRGFVDENLDPLMGKNLFALRGDHWRDMRKLLSPAFTSAKMKTMFNLIVDCADSFSDFIATHSKEGKVLNVKDITGRYATDVIATCSFGIAIDSMRSPKNEFYVFGKQAVNFQSSQSLKLMVGKNFPTLSKLLGIRIINEKHRRYFTRVVSDTVKLRKEKGIQRPDMIQLMMESENQNGKELTIDEMTNQAFIFFVAGYDTSASFLCFNLHEIATNPDVQARLQAEIDDVVRKTNGRPTYEAIRDMPYLDAVMNETNRLYSLVSFLDRVCVKEFELPPATPNSKPVMVKPGGVVWFLPFAMQRDPTHFSDPLRFNPDRFLNDDIPQNVYIPFGLGPRICIGNRFALLESKIALFYLLSRCIVEPCAKTTLPMRFDSQSFILCADKGFWLNFKARNNDTVLRTEW